MKPLASIAVGSAFLAIAVSAAAQTTTPETPTVLLQSNSVSVAVAPQPVQPLCRYNVRARAVGRKLEVRSMHDVPIARCFTGCWLDLPRGDYKAMFYDARGQEHEFAFSVSGPGAIEIEDPDQGAASVALGFGIAGIGLVAGGTVLMAASLSQACAFGECERSQNSNKGAIMLLGGFGATVAGGIMTPIGFYYWARHRNPRMHNETKDNDIEIAVAPTNNGVVFGLSGQF